ncbi:MAG: hypothetical protein ACKORY_08010 [Actinomycetota bacterium]
MTAPFSAPCTIFANLARTPEVYRGGLGILGKDIPVAARLHQRTMAYAKRAASGTANGARKLRRNR